MELVKTLGIDWRILIFQLINFAIIFWVLAKFVFPVLRKTIDARQKEIEAGIKNAELAARSLTNIEEKEKNILAQAQKKALSIVSDAQRQAKENQKEIVAETQKKVAQQIKMQEEKLTQMQEQMVAEAKTELTEIVEVALVKILQSEDLNKDKKLYSDKIIQKALK